MLDGFGLDPYRRTAVEILDWLHEPEGVGPGQSVVEDAQQRYKTIRVEVDKPDNVLIFMAADSMADRAAGAEALPAIALLTYLGLVEHEPSGRLRQALETFLACHDQIVVRIRVTERGHANVAARAARRRNRVWRRTCCNEAVMAWILAGQTTDRLEIKDFKRHPNAIWEGESFQDSEIGYAIRYLVGHRLAERAGWGGIRLGALGHDLERSGLTVEEFVNRAGGVHIGAVTVGTGVGVVAGGTVNQAVKLGIDTSALRQLLQEVRSAVLEDGDDTAYAEVERSIVAVEGELDESNPDRSRVRDRLVGLRQALERMGPDIAAAGILELIKEAITNL